MMMLNRFRLLLMLALLTPLVASAENFQTYWVPVNPMPPTTLADHNLNSMASNGSTYVAVGNDGSIWSSPDGNDWMARASGQSLNFTKVLWNSVRGEFAVIANRELVQLYDTTTFATSSDGFTWSNAVVINDVQLLSLAYSSSSGRYVGVGSNGNIAWSDDGASWTIATVPYNYRRALIDVIWDNINGQFIAVGGSSTFGLILTSTDGATWTELNAYEVGTTNFHAIASDGSALLVAVGEDGYYSTSSDGQTWTTPADTTGNLGK